ncbi:MAG: Gfo/Idh/MocA family protein [Fusobacteriaceae bacterium]
MIKFGIIGRNFIVDRFLEAAKSVEDFELTAIFSRSKESGQEFAEKYGVKNIYTDIDIMISEKKIDAIYIASPNYLHCQYAIKFLNAKIPVLCEKPLASNEKEIRLMIEASQKNNTLLMEAMRGMYNPSLKNIRDNIHKIGKVRGFYGNYCQYSSRYDKYKSGIIENAFKPELSNGSLLDIGIYPTYFALSLFGEPKEIQAEGIILSTGVDGAGSFLMKYDDFVATINHSKVANSFIPSEIIGEDGTITIEQISVMAKVTLKYKEDGIFKEEDITNYFPKEISSDMYFEIKHFIELCQAKKSESDKNPHKNSLMVAKVLDEVRKQLGVIYPADKK